jgi:predicted RNA-binding protein
LRFKIKPEREDEVAKKEPTAESNKGQADHVLAAFRYQLLLSLDAWLSLRKDETLWLEIEEDFSIVSDTNATHIQVKRSAAKLGPRPRSLQSSDVRAALSRFWVRSDQGRNTRSQLAFISNSGAARERNLTFPSDVPGLFYWGISALDADTTPIRGALAILFSGEPIGEWINSHPSDEELRTRLLRRVQWMLAALDAAPLTALIRDKIAEIYLTKGLWVTLVDRI